MECWTLVGVHNKAQSREAGCNINCQGIIKGLPKKDDFRLKTEGKWKVRHVDIEGRLVRAEERASTKALRLGYICCVLEK